MISVSLPSGSSPDTFQDQRYCFLSDLKLAVANLAEHVFTGMGNSFQSGQAQKSARALNRVHEPENAPQNIFIGRIFFKFDKLHVDNGQAFRRFGQKFAKKIVHG